MGELNRERSAAPDTPNPKRVPPRQCEKMLSTETMQVETDAEIYKVKVKAPYMLQLEARQRRRAKEEGGEGDRGL